MRGDIKRAILELLTPDPRPIGGIFGVFFDYHKRFSFQRNKRYEDKEPVEIGYEEKEQNRIRKALSRLKSEGCLEIVDQKWKITEAGLMKMYKLRQKTSSHLPGTRYEKIKSKSTILVMFDIPEGQRQKRIWLRSVLINLGFIMLQRSVWAGKVKLPGEFLADLHSLKIADYVQIIPLEKLNFD